MLKSLFMRSDYLYNLYEREMYHKKKQFLAINTNRTHLIFLHFDAFNITFQVPEIVFVAF